MVPKSGFDLATAAQAYLREEKVKYYLNLQNGACTSFTVHGCASTFQHHKVRKCATEREYNRTEKNLELVDKARTRRTGDDGRDADKAFQFHTTLLKHSRQLRTYHIVRTPRVHHSKTRIQCCFWHAISIINFAVGRFEKRQALSHLSSTRPTFSRISILALYK